MERQTIYGWPVIIDLFLGGLGAGAFLAGFVMDISGVGEPITRAVLFAGPLLVAAGVVFLLADITIRSRAYRLFSNVKSWTSRGTWILTVFIVTGFAYSLASSPYFSRFSLMDGPLTKAAGVIAALFSFLVLIYPGLLMGAIRAVSFWNTPLLPVLFLLSGLTNGLVFIIFLTPLSRDPFSPAAVEMLHLLGGTAVVLMLLQAAALTAFLTRAARGNVASRESLRILAGSLFKWKMFILGIVVPLGLFLFAIFTSQILLLSFLSASAAIFSLAGGLYLRYAVVNAGVFLPRFTI